MHKLSEAGVKTAINTLKSGILQKKWTLKFRKTKTSISVQIFSIVQFPCDQKFVLSGDPVYFTRG